MTSDDDPPPDGLWLAALAGLWLAYWILVRPALGPWFLGCMPR